MRDRIQHFFAGRNGVDDLGRFLNITSLILLILGLFTWPLLSSLGMGTYLYNLYRVLSRNLYKRSMENQAYLQATAQVRAKFAQQKTRMEQRKTHRFFRCPSCKQTVRVPRGKGKIAITCPSCHTQFTKQS